MEKYHKYHNPIAILVLFSYFSPSSPPLAPNSGIAMRYVNNLWHNDVITREKDKSIFWFTVTLRQKNKQHKVRVSCDHYFSNI